MIRRFKDWQSDDDSRWQSSMWNYENYINEKKASIPQALFDFIDRFTLHDGRITHIQEVVGVPTKKDALLTILSPKNGWMCDCDSILVVMHLVGVRGAIKTTVPASDIMFYDVEMLPDSILRISFVFEDGKTWSAKFTEFGVHIHNYRKV